MVSVVYVSYNNPKLISQSIDSLMKFNKKYQYQFFLVAYMFTDHNLQLIKLKYPFLKIIVSDEYRGFAENNNLALKEVNTEFCLVLNDDTYVNDNSIDRLLDKAIETDVKILSPKLLFPDGRLQSNGRPKFGLLGFILNDLKVIDLKPTGVKKNIDFFKTYNVSGACFLIKTVFFKKIGLFNEDYFFTPEDIEISNEAKKLGVYPYVYSSAHIYHIASVSAKKIQQVTLPAAKQGTYLYLKKNYGMLSMISYKIFILTSSVLKLTYWYLKEDSERKNIMIKAWKNCNFYLNKNLTPKQIFEVEIKKIN